MKKIIYIFLLIFLQQSIFAHGGGNDKTTDNIILFGENENIVTTDIAVVNWGFISPTIVLDSKENNRLFFFVESGHHGVIIPGLELETGNMEPDDFVIWDIAGYPEGEYKFYCNIPCGSGHSDMIGTIQIKESI